MLQSIPQDSFDAGIVRQVDGQRIPPNGAYDIVNGLLDDDFAVYRRGGSTYETSSDTSSDLTGVGLLLQAGDSLPLFWRTGNFYKLESGTLTSLSTGVIPRAYTRGASSPGGFAAPRSTGKDIVATTGAVTAAITYTPLTSTVEYLTIVGLRIVVSEGAKVWFTAPGGALAPASTDYHELAARVIGLEGVDQSTCLVFTERGVYAIRNMAFDLTDAYGNVQQSIDLISKELILWGEMGLAGWRGVTLVPAIDDVYMVALGGPPEPLSGTIRPLYRSYVQAGYKPGFASVHRSHYFLPILDGSNVWVDTLVCRLEARAWARWAGHGGTMGGTVQQVGVSSRQPKLLSFNGRRVVNVTGCFDPTASNKNDADSTTHQLTVITRDYTTRRTGQNLWKYLRARFELEDAGTDNPYLTLEYQVGSHTSTWTAVSGNAPESDGTDDFEWSPDVRGQAIRFRIKSNGPTVKCVLRSLEVFFRPSAKR